MGGERVIELELRSLGQLFNSIDPAPFPEKDLDDDIDAFLVSWAKEFPDSAPLKVIIHLRELPADTQPDELAEASLHHYFTYRAELADREFRQLLRRGRTSLLIGLAFLGACVGASRLLANFSTTPLAAIAQESLLIGGWVAMWRPLEILLYDWWPLRRNRHVYRKLARAPVVVEIAPG
ncbi:MAG: hypothetical protein HS104_24665 [Polyangiaceae bacterium]|nr:hypothetical protein [Polyangiaceae bacterium]MCE7893653.1 hypothetical protein [Sorangiineae bacterium PRO1]